MSPDEILNRQVKQCDQVEHPICTTAKQNN